MDDLIMDQSLKVFSYFVEHFKFGGYCWSITDDLIKIEINNTFNKTAKNIIDNLYNLGVVPQTLFIENGNITLNLFVKSIYENNNKLSSLDKGIIQIYQCAIMYLIGFDIHMMTSDNIVKMIEFPISQVNAFIQIWIKSKINILKVDHLIDRKVNIIFANEDYDYMVIDKDAIKSTLIETADTNKENDDTSNVNSTVDDPSTNSKQSTQDHSSNNGTPELNKSSNNRSRNAKSSSIKKMENCKSKRRTNDTDLEYCGIRYTSLWAIIDGRKSKEK